MQHACRVLAAELSDPYSRGLPMISSLRELLWGRSERAAPAIPSGARAYAIGDIHGQLDLLSLLAEAIESDDAARGAAQTTIVLLGDLIDRGPQSAQVLTKAREWRQSRQVRILCGNHEEMFLRAFDEFEVFSSFLRFGGYETLMSYLPDPGVLQTLTTEEAHELWNSVVPQADVEFVAEFEDSVVIGDYLFVHAGIRPGVPLEEQSGADLRWIREPFLGSRRYHGRMVVHGHTIVDEPAIRTNRIGIDTGAYRSGCLTALGLEGTARWLIEAHSIDGESWVDTREI